MTNKLLFPNVSTEDTFGDTVVRKYTFSDGTLATDVVLLAGDKPQQIFQNPDGTLVEAPLVGRYPFTESLARMAVKQFNETGELHL